MLDTTLFRHLLFEVTTSEINHFTVVTTPCTHVQEVTSQIQEVMSQVKIVPLPLHTITLSPPKCKYILILKGQ